MTSSDIVARAVFVTSLQQLFADKTMTNNNQPDHKVEPTVPTVPLVLTFRSRWGIQIIKMSRLGGVQELQNSGAWRGAREHTAALDRSKHRRVLARQK
eukprot:scaffold12573_cov64-Attheya_sp.AAC.2